jgi:hypothetical protein
MKNVGDLLFALGFAAMMLYAAYAVVAFYTG